MDTELHLNNRIEIRNRKRRKQRNDHSFWSSLRLAFNNPYGSCALENQCFEQRDYVELPNEVGKVDKIPVDYMASYAAGLLVSNGSKITIAMQQDDKSFSNEVRLWAVTPECRRILQLYKLGTWEKTKPFRVYTYFHNLFETLRFREFYNSNTSIFRKNSKKNFLIRKGCNGVKFTLEDQIRWECHIKPLIKSFSKEAFDYGVSNKTISGENPIREECTDIAFEVDEIDQSYSNPEARLKIAMSQSYRPIISIDDTALEKAFRYRMQTKREIKEHLILHDGDVYDQEYFDDLEKQHDNETRQIRGLELVRRRNCISDLDHIIGQSLGDAINVKVNFVENGLYIAQYLNQIMKPKFLNPKDPLRFKEVVEKHIHEMFNFLFEKTTLRNRPKLLLDKMKNIRSNIAEQWAAEKQKSFRQRQSDTISAIDKAIKEVQNKIKKSKTEQPVQECEISNACS